MKNLILTLMTLTLSAPAFAGETGFSCRNHMYRDAEFAFSANSLAVQDSYLRGIPQVETILQRQMGSSVVVDVHTIKLTVTRDENLKCDSSLTFLVGCQGSAKRAILSVRGFIRSNGISGVVDLSIPVELKDFHLNSNLRSRGPISIGGESTSVEINTMEMKANAKVILAGEEVDLEWETFFYTKGESNRSSYCKTF